MIGSPFVGLVDRFTRFLVSLTSDHNYIHRGKAFTAVGKSGSVAAGGTYVMSFTTPATKYVHWRPSSWFSTANLGELRIAQGSTVTGGSAATAYNRNHNSSTLPTATVASDVTLSVEGTVKDMDATGGGGNPVARAGGGSGADQELVLLPDTTYSLTFTNTGATTATVFYWRLFWYEEDAGV